MIGRPPLLKVSGIEVIYDRVISVLKGVSLEVPEGGIIALLGANGAGKTTTLKAISSVLKAERGEVTHGRIEFNGERIDGRNAADLVRMGITQVMEGRRLFEHLTVDENLRSGAYQRVDRGNVRQDLDRVYAYFPALRERRRLKAGYLSGGEQQMVAIGRGLMARPKLMLLDEPSLGLAPMLVREVFGMIRRLNEEEGVAVLLAEQNVKVALSMVHYGYVMENGRIAFEGPAEKLRDNETIKEFYLGFSAAGRLNGYRDLKARRHHSSETEG